MIQGDAVDRESVLERLCELTVRNSTAVREYWEATERGRGIPDSAFKLRPPYLFDDEPPARTFRTSGTTGGARGSASYSARGMELMRLSILESARRRILTDLDKPAIVRLVPPEIAAPQMVMAYGMELIATTFGDPELSAVVVGPAGVNYGLLSAVLERATDAGAPVLLIGGSMAFVNVCEELERHGLSFGLPAGSCVVDAGGFKGLSRAVAVDDMRGALARTFGVGPGAFVNLFGMTELASQLYDASDAAVGPNGERSKGGLEYVEPRVLDPQTMAALDEGPGLLEVVDLCLIDRPPAVLTGDLAIASPLGVAICGRIERDQSRGCSLSLDRITAPEPAHV